MRYWWSIGLGTWFKYSRSAYVFWFFCKDFYSKNSIDFWIYSKKFKSNQSIVTKGQQLKIVQHWCHQFDDGNILVTRFEMFVTGRRHHWGRCHQYFGTNIILSPWMIGPDRTGPNNYKNILSCQEKKIQKNYEKWSIWKAWRKRRTEKKKSKNKNSCQDQFMILIRWCAKPIR